MPGASSSSPNQASEKTKLTSSRNPKVMLQVGGPGQVGDVEMQDLMFTTKGATPGAILVQWNIKASKPGSAGLWGMSFRVLWHPMDNPD